MEDCVFCSRDLLKQGLLYEDGACMVVLDKFPITRGHSLVISKEHFVNVLDVDEKVLCGMSKVAKKTGIHLKDVLRADGIRIVTNAGKDAGQAVMHFHIHVIPMYRGDGEKDVPMDVDARTIVRKEINPKEKEELIERLKI